MHNVQETRDPGKLMWEYWESRYCAELAFRNRLIRERFISAHTRPRPRWMPHFLYHWIIKKLFVLDYITPAEAKNRLKFPIPNC